MDKEGLRVERVGYEDLDSVGKKTLIMVKPGNEDLIEEILTEIGRAGLQSIFWGKALLTEEEAGQLYHQDQDEPWHKEFIKYLTTSMVSVFVIRGEAALEKMLEARAEIRSKYALSRRQNVVHAPNSLNKLRENLEFFRKLFGFEPD